MTDNNTEYKPCEYCSVVTECIPIRRQFRPKDFLKKHGTIFICDYCVSILKRTGELTTYPHPPKQLIFASDLTSNYKF